MKKWIFFMLFPFLLFSQNLQVQWDQFFISVQSNQTVQFHGKLQLVDTSQMELAMIRNVMQQPSDWSSSLCVGIQCYSPDVDTAWFVTDNRNQLDVYLDVVTGNVTGIGVYMIQFLKKNDSVPVLSYQLKVSTDPQGINGNHSLMESFKLYPPYPNPFNPVTYIPIWIQSSGVGEISFTVYDINGKLVSREERTVTGGGNHLIRWEAKDNMGQPLPSGIYFFTVRWKNQLKAGKMILMK